MGSSRPTRSAERRPGSHCCSRSAPVAQQSTLEVAMSRFLCRVHAQDMTTDAQQATPKRTCWSESRTAPRKCIMHAPVGTLGNSTHERHVPLQLRLPPGNPAARFHPPPAGRQSGPPLMCHQEWWRQPPSAAPWCRSCCSDKQGDVTG